VGTTSERETEKLQAWVVTSRKERRHHLGNRVVEGTGLHEGARSVGEKKGYSDA